MAPISIFLTSTRVTGFINSKPYNSIGLIMKIFFAGIVFIFGFTQSIEAQSPRHKWVDSVFNALSMEEKIGQVMMIPVYSNKGADHLQEIEKEIKDHHIGGIIFMRGGPVRQAKITNHLQAISSIPLLIGQDAEWGLGMMLDSTINFPRALLLAAIKNDSLVYLGAREIAREMKMIGVHIDFAPVADMNPDPANVISYRSFGSDQKNVANKSLAFMRGLQDNGIMACAKHFVFSGITVLDIKNDLPIIKPSIDTIRAYPYEKLFANGLTAVMPTAADFPLFYEQKNLIRKNKFNAGSLSTIFTGSWLKKEMDYKGLIFIDIQALQNAGNKYRSGEAEMFAFQTENDMLVSPSDIGPAIRRIKKLIKNQDQYAAQLDSIVKKILVVKYNAGLNKKTPIDTDNLVGKLNSPEAQVLNRKLYASAITVIRDSTNILPVKTFENKRFAYLTSDSSMLPNNEFYHFILKYVNSSYHTIDGKTNAGELYNSLNDTDVIIIGVFPQTPEDVIKQLIQLSKKLAVSREVIVCDFGHETFLKQADDIPTLITAYTNTTETLQIMPQIIFGALGANGQLPFSISSKLKEGTSIATKAISRFGYSIPEDAGMDSETLGKIESIANEAIHTGATPGCNVLVAKDGKVIYQKSFGYLTYENKIPVTDETIYDLASVTKVSATLQAVMFLEERRMIDINKKASFYLPELKNSNKKDFTIKDILTHQAGLWPFLPFWAQTMKDSVYLLEFYDTIQSDQYPFMVAQDLYASVTMRDSLWNWIVKSKIREKASRTPYDYRYSDMGFYILQHVAEKLLNQPIEDFIQQNLYEPLGSVTTGYLPLQRFPRTQIAPTEDDKLFRKSLLIGTVHDQGAAMAGGVAGHAGLFSDANDLAKLGQMLLQEGTYGGYQFYKPETVRMFTQQQFETSRRGLGWDKPTQSSAGGPTSLYASPKTFGHTGFTGTCIWVDPEFNLVYVFLSNRVNPDMTNNKLINANIRSRIQDVIYESIFKYCQFKQ